MNARPIPENVIHRILAWLMASRFFTTSLLLHVIFVVMVGGLVLFRVTTEPPDFAAGSEGFLIEAGDQAEPPAALEVNPTTQFAPQAPLMMAPLSNLITASLQSPTWRVTFVPNAPVVGISDSMKSAMASMANRLGQRANMGTDGLGRIGGMRSAMIFGRKIEANRLGVILDVSGSADPYLAGAVTEIQKGFADAILILYPGCGMNDFEGKPGHEIRKYSSIPKQELQPGAADETTQAQIAKALRIQEFEQMTNRASVKETLFVSWYPEKGPDGKMTGSRTKLTFQTQVAFDDLIKRGVDTIYWFSDFRDAVSPLVAERLGAILKSRRIRLHVHNFAGQPINFEVTELAEKSGGTVNIEKPK